MIIQAITGFFIDKSDKRMQPILAMKFKLCFSSLFLSVAVTINDAQIINLIQKNNIDLLQLQNQKVQSQLNFEKIDINYQTYFNLDLSKEIDQTNSLTLFDHQDVNRNKLYAILGKNFTSGTQVSLEGTYLRLNSEKYSNVLTSNFTQNNLNLNLQQQIFPDLIGQQEGQKYLAARKVFEKDLLQNQFDQIDLIKAKLGDYWKIKALIVQIKNNTNLLGRYETLVKKIAKKKSNNMTVEGEYEQAFAEVMVKKQSLSEDQSTLRQLMQKFKEDLSLPTDSELLIDEKVSQVENKPQLNEKPKDITRSNKYKLQKLKLEAAESQLLSLKSSNLPDVFLYGKYNIQGLDNNSGQAFDEMKQGDYNKYLIGLKLNYVFGANSAQSQYELQKNIYNIEKQKFDRITEDLNSYYLNLNNKVYTAYTATQVAQEVYKLRTTISKKLNHSYEQGRIDFAQLLDAYNKESAAQINLITTMGSYQILKYEYDQLTTPLL